MVSVLPTAPSKAYVPMSSKHHPKKLSTEQAGYGADTVKIARIFMENLRGLINCFKMVSLQSRSFMLPSLWSG